MQHSLYETCLNIFNEIYHVNSSLTETEMKHKKLKMLWFSKELKNCSKTKERLCIILLKNENAESENKIKTAKRF